MRNGLVAYSHMFFDAGISLSRPSACKAANANWYTGNTRGSSSFVEIGLDRMMAVETD
jgi:hypothetical protein